MSELQYHDSIAAMMKPIGEAVTGDKDTGQLTGSIDAAVLGQIGEATKLVPTLEKLINKHSTVGEDGKITLNDEGGEVSAGVLTAGMNANADIMTATKAVMGEWAVDTMKDNSKLDVVGLKVDLLGSTLEGRTQRVNVYGKDENSVTKYGQTTMTHKVKSCGTRGAATRVGKIINAKAEEALAAEALA